MKTSQSKESTGGRTVHAVRMEGNSAFITSGYPFESNMQAWTKGFGKPLLWKDGWCIRLK